MKKEIEYLLEIGAKLTSSYHPEGDTYTLKKGVLHYSISPNYKLIDIYNDYPFDKIGRAWYKDIDTLKMMLNHIHLNSIKHKYEQHRRNIKRKPNLKGKG